MFTKSINDGGQGGVLVGDGSEGVLVVDGSDQ